MAFQDQDTPQQPTQAATPPPSQDISLDDWTEKLRSHFGVPKNLMNAMLSQESNGGNTDAKSPTGVKGAFQVTQKTASQYGLDRNDPYQQAAAGLRYLRDQYDALGNIKDESKRWAGAVGRYYGGPDAVSSDGFVSGKTRDGVSNPVQHVERVLRKWNDLGIDANRDGIPDSQQTTQAPTPQAKKVKPAPQPAPQQPQPSLLERAAGPNVGRSLISDVVAKDQALTAKMSQPINLGANPKQQVYTIPSQREARQQYQDFQHEQALESAAQPRRRRPGTATTQNTALSMAGNFGQGLVEGVLNAPKGIVTQAARGLNSLAQGQINTPEGKILAANAQGMVPAYEEATAPIQEAANSYLPVNPQDQGLLTAKLPRMAGGIVPLIATTALTRGRGTSGALSLEGAYGMGLQNAAGAYDDAIANGASESDALNAAAQGFTSGATTGSVGIGTTAAKMGIQRPLSERALEVAHAIGQNVAQTVANNATAQSVGYDPNRSLLQGTGEAALTGGLLSAGMHAVDPRTYRSRPEAKVSENPYQSEIRPTGTVIDEATGQPLTRMVYKNDQTGIGKILGETDDGRVRIQRADGVVALMPKDKVLNPVPEPQQAPVSPAAPQTQPAAPASDNPLTNARQRRSKLAQAVAPQEGAGTLEQMLNAQQGQPVQEATPSTSAEQPAKASKGVEIFDPTAEVGWEDGTKIRTHNVDGKDIIIRFPKGMDVTTAKILAEQQVRKGAQNGQTSPEPIQSEARTPEDTPAPETNAPVTQTTEQLPVRSAEPPVEPDRGNLAESQTVPNETERVANAPEQSGTLAETPPANSETRTAAPVETGAKGSVETRPAEEAPVNVSRDSNVPATEAGQARPSNVYSRHGIELAPEVADAIDNRHATREGAEKGSLGKLGSIGRSGIIPAGEDRPLRSFAEHPALRKMLGLPEIPPEVYEKSSTDWGKMTQHTMDALAEKAGVPRSSKMDDAALNNVEKFLAENYNPNDAEHKDLRRVFNETRAAVDMAHNKVDALFESEPFKTALRNAQVKLDAPNGHLRGPARTALTEELDKIADKINQDESLGRVEGKSNPDITSLTPNAIKGLVGDLRDGRLSGQPKEWLGRRFKEHLEGRNSESPSRLVRPEVREGGTTSATPEVRPASRSRRTPVAERSEPTESSSRNTAETSATDRGNNAERTGQERGVASEKQSADRTTANQERQDNVKRDSMPNPLDEEAFYEQQRKNQQKSGRITFGKQKGESESGGTTLGSNLGNAFDKFNRADIGKILDHLKTHGENFVGWAKAMIKDFGEQIRPKLREIWDGMRKFYADETGSAKASPGGPPLEQTRPRVRTTDLSERQGEYDRYNDEIRLNRETLKQLTPERRAALVRHELAHYAEHQLNSATDAYTPAYDKAVTHLWDLWKKDRFSPIFQWFAEQRGPRIAAKDSDPAHMFRMTNDNADEIIADLYARAYEGNKLSYYDEQQGREVSVDIPKALKSALDEIESKLGIYSVRKERLDKKSGSALEGVKRSIYNQGKAFLADQRGSNTVDGGKLLSQEELTSQAKGKKGRQRIGLPADINDRLDSFEKAAGDIISKGALSEEAKNKAVAGYSEMLDAVEANDGAKFIEAQRKVKDAMTKHKMGAADIARPLNAGGELSVVGRQGFLGWMSNPVISFKALMNVHSSPGGVDHFLAKIYADPDYELMKKAGLDMGMFNELDLSKNALAREENTTGNWVERLSRKSNFFAAPLVAKGITTLERINKTFIDGQRYGIMKHGIDIIRRDTANGRLFDENGHPSQQLKYWTKRINVITGRGNLGDSQRVQAAADLLSTVFYSPRFSVSRFQSMVPYEAIRAMELNFGDKEGFSNRAKALAESFKNRPAISNQMWRDYAKQSIGNIAVTTAIATALTQAIGGKVSLDPDDPDFMKWSYKNVHLPLLQGGIQPAARFAFRMAKRAYEMGKSGVKGDSAGVASAAENAAGQSLSFLRQKEAPIVSTLHDQLLAREDFTDAVTGKKVRMGTNAVGQPVMAGKDLWMHFLPMMYQQAIDTYREAGPGVAVPSAAGEFFGLNVGVYDSGKYSDDIAEGSKNKAKLRQDYSYERDKWYDPRAGLEPDSKFRPRVQRANDLYTKHLDQLRNSSYYQNANEETRAKMEDSLRTKVKDLSYDEQPNESRIAPTAIVAGIRSGERRSETQRKKNLRKAF